MAEITILHQGTEAKCFVAIADVDMSEIDFKVELLYCFGSKVLEIKKEQMSQTSQGKWLFVFNTDGMVGLVAARCVWILPDTDCPDGERTKVDEQPLCFVANTACTKLFACPCKKADSKVSYEFTDDSGIASEYKRLCDCDGHPLATGDDYYLYVRSDAAAELQDALNNIENNNE